MTLGVKFGFSISKGKIHNIIKDSKIPRGIVDLTEKPDSYLVSLAYPSYAVPNVTTLSLPPSLELR